MPSRPVLSSLCSCSCRVLLAVALAAGCGRVGFNLDSAQDASVGVDAAASTDASARPPLVDDGLVVRYFLDEEVSEGTVASSNGLLDLSVEDAATGVVSEELATGRGFRFTSVSSNGRACAPIDGTPVFEALQGSRTGTIEVVADIVAGDSSRSRLAAIGVNGAWSFSAGYSSNDTSFVFSMNRTNEEYGVWVLDAATQGRVVYTFVFDSEQPAPEDRIKMFIDGARIPLATHAVPIALDEGLKLGDPMLCIGNRGNGSRSPEGAIYYAAFYAVALTSSAIMENASRLLVHDDPP